MGTPLLHRYAVMALAAVSAGASGTQAPHAAWRTLATTHYRIHYPPMLAAWAQEVASRIEGIHAQVVALVGYEHPGPMQVLLADPMADANGMAIPLLPSPRMILWRTEPRSDDLHGGTLSTWTETLISHEMTHLQHLTRPSRLGKGLGGLFALPFSPVARKSPRWVTEGFATLAEGRLTGSGRPHSVLRAAVVRQWAREGKLPPYEALNGSQAYLGASMAYLVGSTYLEWLERQRPGQPDCLQALWKHLASPRNASFDAAFQAAFGFGARDGYQRFQAEAAHDALEWESGLKGQGLREGEPFLRVPGTLRNLSVSPDGTRLLAALEGSGVSGLRVWSTRPLPAPSPREAPADAFNRAPVANSPWPARVPEAKLPTLNHQVPQDAEWVDDRTVRFQVRRPDGEGMLHLRPALWRLPGALDMDPVPLPPARWRPLDPEHVQGRWRLVLDQVAVPLPGQAVGRACVDEARTVVWAACEVGGTWNLVRVPFAREGGMLRFEAPQILTRTASAAWNPAPSPDGRTLYFTTLGAQGMEIRTLDLGLPPLAAAPEPQARFLTAQAVLPAAAEGRELPRAPRPFPSAPYRALAEPWLQLVVGATLTPAGQSLQAGVAGTDLLGHFSWQVLAAGGDAAGPRGAMAGFSSTAWAWNPSLTIFSSLERPSRQCFTPTPGDRQRRGGEAALAWTHKEDTAFWITPVAALERVELLGPAGTLGTPSLVSTRALLGLRAGLRVLRARGEWGLSVAPSIQGYSGTTTREGKHGWTLLRSDLALGFGNPILPVTLRLAGGTLRQGAGAGEAFHLGGTATSLVPGSLDSDRIEQPALPARLAWGDRFFRWRSEAGGSFQAYLESTQVWQAGQDRGPAHRVAGLLYTTDAPFGLPGDLLRKRLRMQAGLHRPLDGVMQNRTVATFTLLLRP